MNNTVQRYPMKGPKEGAGKEPGKKELRNDSNEQIVLQLLNPQKIFLG